MTPLDIKNKEFKKTAWGYSPKEVAEFLENVAKTWEKIQKGEKELQDKVRGLEVELTRWKNKEVEIAKLKEKAQQDAEAIRVEAQKEAQKLFAEMEEKAAAIRVKTEEWLASVISEVEETERQKMSFMTAFRSALDSHYEILKQEQEVQEPLGARLNHFLRNTLGNNTRM